MSLVSTSGIRGPVGQTVTVDLAVDLGRVIATQSGDRVVVGHDPRETSEWLTDGLTAGLRACGADVITVGLVPTPTLARAVEWTDADIGVMVTASHNPAEYNGFKLLEPSGRGVPPDEVRKLVNAIRATAHEPAKWDQSGKANDQNGMTERHIAAIADTVGSIESLDVVVDVGNGAGRLTIEALRRIGATVTPLHEEPDGRFPNRPSEPTPENCTELQREVQRSDADLGIALDGDADRMQATTGTGSFVQGDILLAIFAREAADPGDRVVAPINTSLAVDDALKAIGVEVTRTPIGDTYVASEAAAADIAFGGEPSGAWIWPDSTLSPDGPMAACRLASLVAHHGSMDALIDGIDPYPIRRENVSTEHKHSVMDGVKPAVKDRYGERCTTVDGLFVEFDDGWFLIRPSGTEPLIRLTAEGECDDRAEELLERATELTKEERER